MANSVENILKTEVCEEIFQNGYPSSIVQDNKKIHPFDFFMNTNIDDLQTVDESTLLTKWDFEIASIYSFDSIRDIRNLMQSKFNDLDSLRNKLFQYAVKNVQLNADDFYDVNEFYNFVQNANGMLYRQGTADEYAAILTVDKEVVL